MHQILRKQIVHRNLDRQMMIRDKQNKGFTLIEVLVSIFVIAIGLLGLAGLQLNALQNNHSAYLRSQATVLASNIIERMRANSTAVFSGAYNEGTANEDTDCLASSAGCNSTAMAGHDLFEWEALLAEQLPGGEGVVCVDDSPNDGTDSTDTNNGCSDTGNMYVVKIWWRDDRTSTSQRFVTTFIP